MTKAISLPSKLMVPEFHALSELLRVKVIKLLRDQELCVCDLCEALDVNRSKLAFHLKHSRMQI
jgi:ArsR family transcriptional regulator, arsenate/arsenite/antimonite-responsive transcriptional repressor